MGRTKKASGRPARDRCALPDRYVVHGRDQHGGLFLDPAGGCTQQSCGAARKTAARLNRLGGRVFVRRERWNAPAARYEPVTPKDAP